MRRLFFAASIATSLAMGALIGSQAWADSGGGTRTVCHDGVCIVIANAPGGSGNSGEPSGGGAGGGSGCNWQKKPVPCTTQSGAFDAQDGCYYKEADPYPTSGPVYEEYKAGGGGIYFASCPFGNGSGGYVWRQTPPAALPPSPAELARRAFASLTLTKPTTGRYPSGTLKDGQQYTVVGPAYTWYYTDPGRFRTLTARAAAGGNWAEVTVKPSALTFDPGDGRAAVSCGGPGTAWNSNYGVWASSPSGCDYQYPHSSIHEPDQQVTATYGIRWQVTWVGSGDSSGTLPGQTTTSNSTFAVAEVEAVVTR